MLQKYKHTELSVCQNYRMFNCQKGLRLAYNAGSTLLPREYYLTMKGISKKSNACTAKWKDFHKICATILILVEWWFHFFLFSKDYISTERNID